MNIKVKYYDDDKNLTREQDVLLEHPKDKLVSELFKFANDNAQDGDVYFRIYNSENAHSVMQKVVKK